MLDFAVWLSETEWSIALHESLYLYPWIESTHVLSICLFFGTLLFVDLRLTDKVFNNLIVENYRTDHLSVGHSPRNQDLLDDLADRTLRCRRYVQRGERRVGLGLSRRRRCNRRTGLLRQEPSQLGLLGRWHAACRLLLDRRGLLELDHRPPSDGAVHVTSARSV